MTVTPSTDIAAIVAAAAETPERKRFERISRHCLCAWITTLVAMMVAIAGGMIGFLTLDMVLLGLAVLACLSAGLLAGFWHYANRASGHSVWRSLLPSLVLAVFTGAPGVLLLVVLPSIIHGSR